MVTLSKFDASAFLALAERERATRAWAVPAQLVDLVVAARAAAPALALREVRTAGAVVGAAFVHDVRDALGAAVTVHWGMSEIGGGITSYGRDLTGSPSALGTPLPGAQVRIARRDGNEAACDEVGELWYRRADMFRGYYRDEVQTGAAITPDGWLRTGDLAARDAAGVIHYHGRAKDLVNRGGFKIGAAEIEAHVAALPAIRRCALVAVPDLRLGERACLVAELHDGATLTLDEVAAQLDRDGVAKFKWPEHLVLVDAMPMTATNKIAKATVRALAAQRVAGDAAVHA
jgi:cyclohexanecarboxylate-CoA ligase